MRGGIWLVGCLTAQKGQFVPTDARGKNVRKISYFSCKFGKI